MELIDIINDFLTTIKYENTIEEEKNGKKYTKFDTNFLNKRIKEFTENINTLYLEEQKKYYDMYIKYKDNSNGYFRSNIQGLQKILNNDNTIKEIKIIK